MFLKHVSAASRDLNKYLADCFPPTPKYSSMFVGDFFGSLGGFGAGEGS